MTRRCPTLAFSILLFAVPLAATAGPFGLAPSPAPPPAPAPGFVPEAGWVVDRVIPYVGAVVYPLGRRIMALENRPRPLDAEEIRMASKVFAGFAPRDRATLIGKMRIRYEAPMRTPWSEFQKLKRACEDPPTRLGPVVKALARATFLGLGPCGLLDLVERRGWTDYLPRVTAGAQATGPEIYIGKARDLEDPARRRTVFHEMEHVKQWWESHRGTSDLRRDMAMGYQYFRAHVDAGYRYRENRFEAGARATGERLGGEPQARP
jgi:hypothetical protein